MATNPLLEPIYNAVFEHAKPLGFASMDVYNNQPEEWGRFVGLQTPLLLVALDLQRDKARYEAENERCYTVTATLRVVQEQVAESQYLEGASANLHHRVSLVDALESALEGKRLGGLRGMDVMEVQRVAVDTRFDSLSVDTLTVEFAYRYNPNCR